MQNKSRVGDLEILQDLEHERQELLAERIGWGLMILFIGAALAGLLGAGPLSHAEAGTRDSGLWVEYNRFERWESESTITVNVGPRIGPSDQIRLWMDRQAMESIVIEHLDPAPLRAEAAAGRLTYVFLRADAAPLSVIFRLKFKKRGGRPMRIGVEGGPQTAFTQWIYP